MGKERVQRIILRITEANTGNKHFEWCLVHRKCSVKHQLEYSPQPHLELTGYLLGTQALVWIDTNPLCFLRKLLELDQPHL